MKNTIFAMAAIAVMGLATEGIAKSAEKIPPKHSHHNSQYLGKMKDSDGNIVLLEIDMSNSDFFVDDDGRVFFIPHYLDKFMDDTSRSPQEPVHLNAPGVDVE